MLCQEDIKALKIFQEAYLNKAQKKKIKKELNRARIDLLVNKVKLNRNQKKRSKIDSNNTAALANNRRILAGYRDDIERDIDRIEDAKNQLSGELRNIKKEIKAAKIERSVGREEEKLNGWKRGESYHSQVGKKNYKDAKRRLKEQKRTNEMQRVQAEERERQLQALREYERERDNNGQGNRYRLSKLV